MSAKKVKAKEAVEEEIEEVSDALEEATEDLQEATETGDEQWKKELIDEIKGLREDLVILTKSLEPVEETEPITAQPLTVTQSEQEPEPEPTPQEETETDTIQTNDSTLTEPSENDAGDHPAVKTGRKKKLTFKKRQL